VAATYLCHPLPSLSHQQPQTAAIGLWCSFCCHQAIGSQISHLEPVVPASDDGCICGLKLKHVLWAVEIAAWQKRPRAKKRLESLDVPCFRWLLFCFVRDPANGQIRFKPILASGGRITSLHSALSFRCHRPVQFNKLRHCASSILVAAIL
jgi:hypothetical protein